MSNLLSELEAVVGNLPEDDDGPCIAPSIDAGNFLRTHHAEIAADAKDAARYRLLRDVVCRIGSGWSQGSGQLAG